MGHFDILRYSKGLIHTGRTLIKNYQKYIAYNTNTKETNDDTSKNHFEQRSTRTEKNDLVFLVYFVKIGFWRFRNRFFRFRFFYSGIPLAWRTFKT